MTHHEKSIQYTKTNADMVWLNYLYVCKLLNNDPTIDETESRYEEALERCRRLRKGENHE